MAKTTFYFRQFAKIMHENGYPILPIQQWSKKPYTFPEDKRIVDKEKPGKLSKKVINGLMSATLQTKTGRN